MFAGNVTRPPAYVKSKYRLPKDGLPGADYILEHSFWVGVHPRYTEEDREYMVKVFDDFFSK